MQVVHVCEIYWDILDSWSYTVCLRTDIYNILNTCVRTIIISPGASVLPVIYDCLAVSFQLGLGGQWHNEKRNGRLHNFQTW